jgi:hypothetical protein
MSSTSRDWWSGPTPNVGTRVTTLSSEEIRDRFEVRVALEMIAAVGASQRAAPGVTNALGPAMSCLTRTRVPHYQTSPIRARAGKGFRSGRKPTAELSAPAIQYRLQKRSPAHDTSGAGLREETVVVRVSGGSHGSRCDRLRRHAVHHRLRYFHVVRRHLRSAWGTRTVELTTTVPAPSAD